MTPGSPFRFIQTGDIHLDQPLGGLAEVPKHLREIFLSAPRQAMQQVVENALLHEVDFVLITGNVLDVRHSSPVIVGFLLDQLETLNDAGIKVYWLGGESDPPARWPASIHLPSNVHTIGPGKPVEILHQRGDLPICLIIAQGYIGREPGWSQFRPDAAGLFTIGALHGEFESDSIARSQIPYWALGGKELRDKLNCSPAIAVYAGSPQGRTVTHNGQRGCTLVEVDEEGDIAMEAIPTDVCRWQSEIIELENCKKVSDLTQIIKNRLNTLNTTKGNRQLMIDWRVMVANEATRDLLKEETWQEITDELNKQFGEEPMGSWTYELTVETASVIPEGWYQEQSICGDYLRLTRELAADPSLPIELTQFLAAGHEESQLAEAVSIESRENRRRVLQDARRLGVRLLRAE
ncbi:hypothetical protein C5Y96_24645 [Blastopirellula marina]|uniref:Calcineurin-like phosphoesterase domain-containing protein n=1 Tax=Blastopirellula marina TaxID=124 RepID=A0A2S8F045_9BACT|nr:MULTISPECIES: metallophosphoesterase [Pirellulaceae]PQO25529.1 hypothetical protein C5Y96_24645 [Blastopirellula marina]RCS42493.1 hypothetical protein DTL36_24695 [Bremerella cremea]